MTKRPSKVIITEEWFLPHFPPRKDRPLEMKICELWGKFASYENYYGDEWSAKFIGMMRGIPRVQNVRSGRMAATFVLWSTTNNGRAFLRNFYLEQPIATNDYGDDSKKIVAAVQYFAKENMLHYWSRNNLLEHLLRDENGKQVYKDRPHPTLEDYRVVERICIFFSREEGKDFLRDVYNEDNNINLLPF